MKIYQDKILANAFDADKCNSKETLYYPHKAQRKLTTIEQALNWMIFATIATISHPKELKV
jgi:hypothetical protein